MAFEKHAPAPIAGLNKSKKLIKSGQADKVYLAADADAGIIALVEGLCRECGITPDTSKTKSDLRGLCGIEVDCAVCVVPKSI